MHRRSALKRNIQIYPKLDKIAHLKIKNQSTQHYQDRGRKSKVPRSRPQPIKVNQFQCDNAELLARILPIFLLSTNLNYADILMN